MLRIVRIVRPRVNAVRRFVPFQLEYLNDAFPDRSALKYFFHWYAFNVLRFNTMNAPNYISQLLDITHALAFGSAKRKRILA